MTATKITLRSVNRVGSSKLWTVNPYTRERHRFSLPMFHPAIAFAGSRGDAEQVVRDLHEGRVARTTVLTCAAKYPGTPLDHITWILLIDGGTKIRRALRARIGMHMVALRRAGLVTTCRLNVNARELGYQHSPGWRITARGQRQLDLYTTHLRGSPAIDPVG